MPLRILHIDDDSMMIKIYKARLEAEGCSMRSVSTGKEGIDVATSEKFDVILLDHILPDMTSFEVLGTLKEKGVLEYSKVVVLTASGQENDAERSKVAGASAFFSKDKVSPRDMLAELTKVVGVKEASEPASESVNVMATPMQEAGVQATTPPSQEAEQIPLVQANTISQTEVPSGSSENVAH